MKTFFTLLLFLYCAAAPARADCAGSALEVPPALPAETRRDFEAKLARAREEYGRAPSDADRLIWVGRRTAYLGRYKEAVRVFTEGVKKFPADARLYRHRGHRLITLRCFDAAVKDLEKATRLVKNRPDEVEPDGLPNARGVPTGTLQFNVWYHLGLAYYLKKDFRRALGAYREAGKVSKNPDTLVATTHWLYMTLRRMGRDREAEAALAAVGDGLDVIENGDYYKLVKLYQGKLKPTELLAEHVKHMDTAGGATVGYGVGNWFLYNGRRELAEQIFGRVTAGSQWSSFGYIAAEAESGGGTTRSERLKTHY